MDEGVGVFREARATPAGAGLEEFLTDALVVADAEDHVIDVGPNGFAHRGDGVDVRDLGGQEGVGGVLDRLGRGGRGDDEGGGDAEVERGNLDRGGLIVGADDDAVGV